MSEIHRPAVLETSIPGIPVKRGKVRDVYDFGDCLLFVASDRISAFDHILPAGIPDKGAVLTGMTRFWMDRLELPNHLLDAAVDQLALPSGLDLEDLRRRSMIVRKAEVIPVECVVRGYLAGSGWKDYQRTGAVCGIALPPGMLQAQQLPEPIFTPATKAETGHDENIPFEQMIEAVGRETAEHLRNKSLEIYRKGREYAAERGILIADTKFEFGWCDGEIILIDEVLTADSSRFWPADEYEIGVSPPSFDKQFVRDWLETSGWDKQSPPPMLPDDVITGTRQRYCEALRLLTGHDISEL